MGFYQHCGCPQGDPISTYLFELCAEILAAKIRSNKNIKRYQQILFNRDTIRISSSLGQSASTLVFKYYQQTLQQLAKMLRSFKGTNTNFGSRSAGHFVGPALDPNCLQMLSG